MNASGRCSIPAEILDDLGVALGSGAEGEQIETLVPGLEGAGDGGADSDRAGTTLTIDLISYVIENLHANS